MVLWSCVNCRVTVPLADAWAGVQVHCSCCGFPQVVSASSDDSGPIAEQDDHFVPEPEADYVPTPGQPGCGEVVEEERLGELFCTSPR